MQPIPIDQIQIVWYQDSISGETMSSGMGGKTVNFWVHMEFFPREVTEAFLMEEGESRPHPKDGWSYARGMLR